ncbi:MAG TPA: tetratricopeptide repeat-containing sensor histidine kinase, partial [Tenuifilaceae bacterium]|nr:tetratricopeptide repeat-containing sensor histidine kinase [Tenuifilaceae bacterium]
QISNARAMLAQALKISSRINDQKDIADIFNEMGNVEKQAGNYDIAIKHYRKAAEVYQSLSNFDSKALCIRKIGEIQIIKKQFTEAEENINQSIKTGFQTGNAYLKSYGYLAKHDLYKAKGNHKLALSNYILHTKIKDSLENLKRNEANLEAQLDLELDQKKTEIKVMEAEVETLKQKAELDKANIEKQRNFRNFLIVVILLVLTLLGAAILSFWQKRKYAQALEEKIEEIKQINEKLIESETHLKQTVQTKDKLFSIIAHDLRSPFTALVGLSEVLSEKSNELSSEEIAELSKHIHQSATGVLALTDNLLSWSRSQTGKLTINPQTFSLKEIVDNIVTVASIPAQEKKIAINTKIGNDLNIYADFDTISTAIRNLISNAIKFTPTGGSISVSGKKVLNYIEIKVADTGIGIEPENLAKLFRVDGLTTKGTNQESGTGLGLILCKEFVEKNNGNISVESIIGLGTTFTITIPVND